MRVEPPNEEALELSWTGNAYLNCAQRLCKDLIEDDHERSLHHYRVPLLLAFLGLELFYKAGVASAGHRIPPHHDLAVLRDLYAKAVPGLPLSIPSYFERRIPKSHDLFKDLPAPTLEHEFARLRYASDRHGKVFPPHEIADLRELQQELDELARATQRVQFYLWRKYGQMDDGAPPPARRVLRRRTHAVKDKPRKDTHA